MENPIQPTVSLTVADPARGAEVTFALEFNFEVIARVEDMTGRSLLLGLTQREIKQPSISFVRAMLFAALLPKEPKIEFSEASAFVTRKTIHDIWAKVLEAWVLAMSDPEDTPADPPAGQS